MPFYQKTGGGIVFDGTVPDALHFTQMLNIQKSQVILFLKIRIMYSSCL